MIEQGTDAWFEQRLGKVTGSQLSNVLMTRDKAGYKNYMAQLVCERLTGKWVETYTSPAMQRGKDLEARARCLYELETGNTVREVGFIDHPTIPNTGASPDGLIGAGGNWETKCTIPATHLKNLENPTIAKVYRLQMIWEMECSQTKWTDFVSFCPEFPPEMQLHVRRIEFDEQVAVELRRAVKNFLMEVSAEVAKLKARFPK